MPSIGSVVWAARQRPGSAVLVAVAAVLFVGYLIAFWLTDPFRLGIDIGAALINSLTATLGAAAIATVTRRRLIGRPFARQATAHSAFALIFAIYWYVAVIVLTGWLRGSIDDGFFVRPFIARALVWQFFQGVMFYVAVVAVAVAFEAQRAADQAIGAVVPPPRTSTKILVKLGDELSAIEFGDVVCINGSDDYSEVRTLNRRYLARRSLTEFQKMLSQTNFVRVHRSHIVNLDHLSRAEPAGNGRLTLHMANGDAVVASRAGTRLLRERAV